MALSIEAEWEQLTSGTPEERACFAALGIRYGDVWLTQADDAFVKRVREKVHLSGYRLCGWLASNWWPFRLEPRTYAPDVTPAHRMTMYGVRLVWSQLTVMHDG